MDLNSLDLRKLRIFYLVTHFGNLRLAAARLNITTSAVSFSLRQFEEQLGSQLFERTSNRLILTDTGKRFSKAAETIFDGISKALREVSLDEHPTGRLSISVNSDIAWYFIPRIGEFLKINPEIELDVYIKSSSDALRLVASGEIDVGIGRFVKVPKTVMVAPIVESSISMVCLEDHPLAGSRELQLSDLARYKLVTLSGGHSTRAMIDAAFKKSGIVPRRFIEVGNCLAVCDFVSAGIGIGLVHTFCTRQKVSYNLRYRELSRHLGKGAFSAIYKKQIGSHGHLIKKLKDSLLVPFG